MGTYYDYDNTLTSDGCGLADETYGYDEDEEFDDPFDVVMYDIESDSDDLYALVDMLGDTARSWYAKRRLNALSASGPLSALVAAGIIIDSLGRRWNPLLHPRDRFGRFISTGGFLRWLSAGEWLRGQVERIDSDGVIHVRSYGNDKIPDGSVVRFKPENASKLVSVRSPKGTLGISRLDLDADIPDFPEASDTQKRIYNALQLGDMPVEDLDVYRTDRDLPNTDFAQEVLDLESRELLNIDRTGDTPRASRHDDSDLGVLDVGDDIEDVPESEAPELEDSPALTREQRSLLDTIYDTDRGENDGVGRDEIEVENEEDLQALIDGGMLDENEDGRLFLENPEPLDEATPPEDSESGDGEADIIDEIFNASEEILSDGDEQEAFRHFAQELARPGDPENEPLDEARVSVGKRRRAQAAAQKWWDERNGVQEDDSVASDPDAEEGDPRGVINPRNQGVADDILREFFGEDTPEEWFESDDAEQYAQALRALLDAEDLEANGFLRRADIERDKARRSIKSLGVEDDEQIAGWDPIIKAWWNADREESGDVVETPADELPEASEADVDDDYSFIEDPLGGPRLPDMLEQIDMNADFPADDSEPTSEEDRQLDLFADAPEAEEVPEVPEVPEVAPEAEEIQVDEAPEAPEVPEEDVRGDDERNLDMELDNDADLNRRAREIDPENVAALEELVKAIVVENRGYDDNARERRDAAKVELGLGAVEPDALEQNGDWIELNERANELANELGDRWPNLNDAPIVRSAPPPVARDEHPGLQAIINNAPINIEDHPFITEDGRGVRDRNGRRVAIGEWYKSRRGGEGDLNQIVGFYDQEKFPGWLLGRSPDGKAKAVHVVGAGREGGLNYVAPANLGPEVLHWQAQRRANIGKEIVTLDEFDPANKMWDNQPARVGMAIMRRPVARAKNDGGRFKRDEMGVVARVSKDTAGRIQVWVVRPGDRNQDDLVPVGINMLQEWDGPIEGTSSVPGFRDAPDAPDAPDANAPDVSNTPEVVIPDGAENDFEAFVLNAIDGANGPLRRLQIIDLDDDDAGEKLVALRDLVNRDVVRQVDDPEGGARPAFERVTAVPEPEVPRGAQNDVDAELLRAVDFTGDTGVRRDSLIDIDADDAPEKINALNSLIRRRVIVADTNESGEVVYRRAPAVTGPVPMDNLDALQALKSGADPHSIANGSLRIIMRAAGYQKRDHKNAGISPNEWLISPNDGEFGINIPGYGDTVDGKVYMSKGAPAGMSDATLNELMAYAISADVMDRNGRDNPGVMYHPKVSIGEGPKGVGGLAGGRIIMDHAAYGFPQNYDFESGATVDDRNAASEIVKLGLYDYLINNNRDRHTSNQMFAVDPSTGRVSAVVFDNGYGFGAARQGEGDSFKDYATKRSKPNELLRRAAQNANRADIEQAVSEFVEAYSSMDIDAIMARIRASFPDISPEQEAYVLQWLATAKERADQLVLDIPGVADIIVSLAPGAAPAAAPGI